MASSSESVCDDQGDYQWPWCQMGHFGINFIQTDGSKAYVEGDLSRAYIKDYELLRASKRPKDQKLAEEKIQEDLDEMSLKEVESEANGDTVDDKILDEKDMAYEVLPKWTSDKKKGRKKKIKGRYNYRSFNEYWDVASFYLTQMTWLNDFGDQMNEENKEELRKQCEEMKPVYPIEQHENLLENPDYQHVTKSMIESKPGSTYEEIYSEHCELIKKKSEIDYHAHQTKAVTRRCKDMISRVKRLGYPPGFEESQLPSFYDLSTEQKHDKPLIKEIRYTIDDAFSKKF